MKTKPVIRRLNLEEIRNGIARFESAHPGIGAGNFPDVFRDANGELIESEEFFAVCRLYGLLAASGE